MNIRHLFLLRTILNASMAAFCISLPLWTEADQTGMYFAVGLSLLFVFLAFKNYRQLKGSVEPYSAPQTPPKRTEQAAFFRRLISIILPFILFATGVTVLVINKFESGTAPTSARLWEPIAYLYEHYGYWAGVLATPVLGSFVIFVLWKKSRA